MVIICEVSCELWMTIDYIDAYIICTNSNKLKYSHYKCLQAITWFNHQDSPYINFWEPSPLIWRSATKWSRNDIMMRSSWYPHYGESIWRISTAIIIRGSRYALHSFSLNHGFSQWVFLVRFLMRQYQKRIRRILYIVNHWTIKGECYEDYCHSECPIVTPMFIVLSNVVYFPPLGVVILESICYYSMSL